MQRMMRFATGLGACLLGLMALLTFVDVLARYLLSRTLPGAYDLGQQLQAIVIFWGMAVATYERAHIGVDLLWERLSATGRQWLDRFADLVCAWCFAALLVCCALQLPKMLASSEIIPDLGVPLWLFAAIALVGIALAVAGAWLAAARAPSDSAPDEEQP